MPTPDNYLADLGYTGLAMPRMNVPPLTLMLMEDDRPWTRIGRLDQVVLPGGTELPEIQGPEPASDVDGKVTRTVEMGLALKILSPFLSAVGAGAGLEAKYRGATEADVEFESVTTQYVDLVPLDTYLSSGRVNDAAHNVMLWLNDDKCVVIINVLRSPQITMTARRDKTTNFEVNLPEIEQVVKADVKVSASSERTSTVSFKAVGEAEKQGVIFGVQALQLNYEGNVFHTWRTVEAQRRLRDLEAIEDDGDVDHEEDVVEILEEEPDRMPVQEHVIDEIVDRAVQDVPAPRPRTESSP